MYILIGIREEVSQREVGGSFESTDHEDRLAHFSTEELAHAYADRYRLARPVRDSYAGERRFAARSLLGECYDYVVEGEDDLPVDPV